MHQIVSPDPTGGAPDPLAGLGGGGKEGGEREEGRGGNPGMP